MLIIHTLDIELLVRLLSIVTVGRGRYIKIKIVYWDNSGPPFCSHRAKKLGVSCCGTDGDGDVCPPFEEM